MTVKEVVENTKRIEDDIEKNRQKAAYAARELWNLLEYPQVVENGEKIQEKWEKVADTLYDLKMVIGNFEELMRKEVKED